MQLTSLLVLLTGPLAVFACADKYFSCRCDNADGNPNIGASISVCNEYIKNPAPDTQYVWDGARAKCVVGGGTGDDDGSGTFDNCNFRKRCAAYGATGDSSCGTSG